MSFARAFADLPIGILPGSVPDDPAVPVPAGPAVPVPQPASGRDFALKMAHDLHRLTVLTEQLLRVQETNRRNFLGDGSLTGGGTVGTVPEGILNANPKRRGLSVQNTGTAGNLTLGLGQTEPQSGTGIVLPPGSSWDGRISGAMWVGSLSIVGSTADVAFSWLEVSG